MWPCHPSTHTGQSASRLTARGLAEHLQRLEPAPLVLHCRLRAVDLDRPDIGDLDDRSAGVEFHIVSLDNETLLGQLGDASGKALNSALKQTSLKLEVGREAALPGEP